MKHINDIFENIAKKANLNKTTTYKPKNRAKQKPSEKWFDHDCKRIRQELRLISNQKHKDPVDSELRLKHSELLKHYKNTLRQKKLDYYNNTLQKMEDTIDQGQFWSTWNGLNQCFPNCGL